MVAIMTDSKRFEGFYEDSALPIKRGDTVTILKGTTIHTTMPRTEDRTRVAKKTYKIRVDHLLNGTSDIRLVGGQYVTTPTSNPSVRWPGVGGYWFEADINDIPEAAS